MRFLKKATRREYIAGAVFSLGLIFATILLYRWVDYAVFVLLAVVGACQLLVLSAIERGQAIERRKIEKLQKRLDKVGNAEQIHALGSRVEESLSVIEGKLDAKSKENLEQEIDFPLVAVEEFIGEMDRFDDNGRMIPLSRLVSLLRVLRVVQPQAIVGGTGVTTSLRQDHALEDIEYWSFEDMEKASGVDKRMVVVVDASHADWLPKLILESNVSTSGILLIDLDEWAMPTDRFVEVLPAELLVGVRFFYPKNRVIDPDVWDMTTGSHESEDG